MLPMFLGCKEKLDLKRRPDAKASGNPNEVDNSSRRTSRVLVAKLASAKPDGLPVVSNDYIIVVNDGY